MELVNLRENGRRFLPKYSLQNTCIKTILFHKKDICLIAAQTALNPMDELGKRPLTISIQNAMSYNLFYFRQVRA
jgi:hypothetical protein